MGSYTSSCNRTRCVDLLAGGAVEAVGAGAVEAVLGLVAQPGVAGALVAAGLRGAALQHHGAVPAAPARRARAVVRGALVHAAPVRARLVPAHTAAANSHQQRNYFIYEGGTCGRARAQPRTASQIHLLPEQNHNRLRRSDEKLSSLMYGLGFTSTSSKSSTSTVIVVPVPVASSEAAGVY